MSVSNAEPHGRTTGKFMQRPAIALALLVSFWRSPVTAFTGGKLHVLCRPPMMLTSAAISV